MIIKSFIAESAAAALKQVRHQMGGEAVVLKTRQLSGGGPLKRVEVTALLDSPTIGQSEKILQSRTSAVTTAAPGKPEEATASEFLRQLLVENDFSSSYTDELIIRAGGSFDDPNRLLASLSLALTEDSEARVISDLSFEPGDRVLIAGPAGSGKTSLLGKLAARLILQEKKKVQLISLDQFRIGAGDELRSYAALLGAEAVDPFEAESHKLTNDDSVTLIEVPALEIKSESMTRLRETLQSFRVTHSILTLSALARNADLSRLLRSAYEFDPQYLALTQTDMTGRFGALLSLLHNSSIKLAFVTDGPGGVGEVKNPNLDDLLKKMLMTEADHV